MTNHPNRSKKTVLAWHFLSEKKLANGDGRRVQVGKKLIVTGDINLCANGLHGSMRMIDALGYAQGNILCRVRHSGVIVHGDDKLCSSERTVLWMGDIERLLHEFACDEAERALNARREAGDTIDPRSTAAITAKRGWLKGAVTDTELAAAWDAAWDAAWTAARAAAWDAAWDAARAAAWAAAWDAAWTAARAAAWDAAWTAARAAARAAAWDAAWTAARAAAWDAAWDAARAAAWDAAWDAARAAAWAAQNDRLTAAVMKLIKAKKSAPLRRKKS